MSSLVGSLLYMSPEQIEAPDSSADSRADIWALGVILYELLTMKTPFLGDTLPQVSIKIAVRPPVPIRDVRAEVPEGLARAMATCLEKERSKRYANVGELSRAIAPFGSSGARASIDPARSPANASVTDSVAAGALTSSSASSPAPTKPTPLTGAAAGGTRGRAALFSSIPWDRKRHAVAAIIAIAGALTLILSVASAWRGRPLEGGGAAAESAEVAKASPTVPSSAATGATVATPAESPRSLSPAETTAAPVASPPPASATPKAPPAIPAARVAARRPTTTGAAPSTAHAGCDVDFELDSQGRKHFKPECVSGAQTSPGTAASPKPDCDPNYDLDAQGRKRFKPQCFLNANH